MSTSRALIATKKSSWKDPALTGALLTLKIAKEATGDVPVVKQIVGVALSIVEIVEKAEKNRDALRMLAGKAAALAQLVKKVVDGRAIDEHLSQLLERLAQVLQKVEDFVSEESANLKGKTFKNFCRSVFKLGKDTEELLNELNAEIAAFTIATLIDTRQCMTENSPYDGRFMHLRDVQVRKLPLIFLDRGNVVFQQAIVQGESDLMVVKYFKATGPTALISESDMWTSSTEEILRQISSLEVSHDNVVQLYGRSIENGKTRFIVLRTGAHQGDQYLKKFNYITRIQEYYCSVESYVLAASVHLQRMGIAWVPASSSPILVDDHGRPSIGAFDDLVTSTKYSQKHHALMVLHTLGVLFAAITFKVVRYQNPARPDSFDKGRLKVLMEIIIRYSPLLRRIWTRIRDEELGIKLSMLEEPAYLDYGRMDPDTKVQADQHNNELLSRAYPSITQPQSRVPKDGVYGNTRYDGRGFLTVAKDGIDGYGTVVKVGCRLVSYNLFHGFQVTLDQFQSSRNHHTYLIELPTEITADIRTMLNLPDTPVDELDSQFSCYLFQGDTCVPTTMMKYYV